MKISDFLSKHTDFTSEQVISIQTYNELTKLVGKLAAEKYLKKKFQ